MAAAMAEVREDRLVCAREMRIACGNAREVREVSVGDPWPADAEGRVDVLVRTGHVVRFLPDGTPARESAPHVRRLGIAPPPLYPARGFLARARATGEWIESGGARMRVFVGRADGAFRDLYVSGRRAYALRRGVPDAVALELEGVAGHGGRAASPNGSGRVRPAARKKASKKAPTKKKTSAKRRRRPKA